MSVPRCPSCGYTKKDAQFHGDHRLCKNAGNAPWEKGHTSVPPAPPTIEEVARKTRANLQEGFRRAFEKLEAEPAPPAPAAPPAVKLEYQIPPVASTFVTYSDEMQDPEKCPICNGYHIGGCHRAPGAQETAEPVTAEVALLQSRLTHISFTVTGNDHALIDCDPKQVDALLKSYAETLTKESLEILGGRADLEKIRADIAEEKVARLNENYRMMSIRSEKAEAEIRNLHVEVARLEKEVLEYGDHLYGCNSHHCWHEKHEPSCCDCGFSAAEARIRELEGGK